LNPASATPPGAPVTDSANKLSSAGNARRPQSLKGSSEFEPVDQSRGFVECHFDLRRIRAARFGVFLTMADLENSTSRDLESALCATQRQSFWQNEPNPRNPTERAQSGSQNAL
jgi:hypothetical protein